MSQPSLFLTEPSASAPVAGFSYWPEAFTAAEPPGAEAPAWLGHLYTDAAGERWQEINLQALSQQPQFLSIGA